MVHAQLTLTSKGFWRTVRNLQCFAFSRHCWIVLLLGVWANPNSPSISQMSVYGWNFFHFHWILSLVVYLLLQRVGPCGCSVWLHCVYRVCKSRIPTHTVYLWSNSCIWQDVFWLFTHRQGFSAERTELGPSTFGIFWFTWKDARRKIPQIRAIWTAGNLFFFREYCNKWLCW